MTDDDQHFTDEGGQEFSLVMPFTVVTSRGGPYDDEAFVAGWACGEIMATLRYRPWWKGMVREDSLAQVDLIAMHYKLTMVKMTDPEDGWVEVQIG